MSSLSAARPAAEPDKKILIAIHYPDLLNEFENNMYITELRETSKIDAGEFAGIKSTLIRGEHAGFIDLMEKAPPSVLGCKNGGLSLFSMLKEDPASRGASGKSRKEAFLSKASDSGSISIMPVDGVDNVVIVIYNNSDVDMGDVRRYITDKMVQIVAALRNPLADLSGIFPKKPAAPSGAGAGAAAAPGSASGPGSAVASRSVAPGAPEAAEEGALRRVEGSGKEGDDRKYMKMSGGAKKKSKKASKKRSKKASKKMSGGAKKKSKKASKKRSKKASKKMSGGAKKKSKKASKKRSKKASKKMSGGAKKKSKKASKKRSKKASKKMSGGAKKKSKKASKKRSKKASKKMSGGAKKKSKKASKKRSKKASKK